MIIENATMTNEASKQFQIYKYKLDEPLYSESTNIIHEARVTLTVNGEDWLTFMCTPMQLEELGIGFLFNENIITGTHEIVTLKVCNANIVDIWLNKTAKAPQKWTRTSGCTGGQTSLSLNVEIDPVDSTFRITPETIFQNVKKLLESQEIYRDARGIHCSALSDGVNLFLVAEDIGRHNTFDKISGLYLKQNKISDQLILLTTGRISTEMMLKAARLKVPIVISLTSPTSGSIDLAKKLGITLVGYARKNSFNIYTHQERIVMVVDKFPINQ